MSKAIKPNVGALTKQVTSVYAAGARLRWNIEENFNKTSGTVYKSQGKINTLIKRQRKAKELMDSSVKRTTVKNMLPKDPTKKTAAEFEMLDQMFDAVSQFYRQHVSSVVSRATSALKGIGSDWWLAFSKHPKLTFAGVMAAGGVVSFNMVRGAFTEKDKDEGVIPKNYRRGYDLISEYTSDFGSPVKASVITRALNPYISSIRKGLVKSVNSLINSNEALSSSKNAIGHTRY